MYLDDIERIALKGLRDNLAHSDVIAAYVDEYAARKRLKRAASQDHARFERRAGEINRLVDLIVKGVPPEILAPRLRDLETERGTMRASLEAAEERDSVITLHPGALTRYKAAVAELAKELARGEPDKVAGSLAQPAVTWRRPATSDASGSTSRAGSLRYAAIQLCYLCVRAGHVLVGSGGGTRTPDPRIMIPVL